jgi:Na+-transporting methylmalonyl-CoA/oxaloacetate decarboxylase gamma subunit
MYTLVLVDTYLPRNFACAPLFQKILDYFLLANNVTFFVTMIVTYYYYVDDYYNMEDGCVLPKPYVVFTIGMMFSFYLVIVLACLVVCVYAFYDMYVKSWKKGRFEKKLKNLLQNVYYDKEEIKQFY